MVAEVLVVSHFRPDADPLSIESFRVSLPDPLFHLDSSTLEGNALARREAQEANQQGLPAVGGVNHDSQSDVWAPGEGVVHRMPDEELELIFGPGGHMCAGQFLDQSLSSWDLGVVR